MVTSDGAAVDGASLAPLMGVEGSSRRGDGMPLRATEGDATVAGLVAGDGGSEEDEEADDGLLSRSDEETDEAEDAVKLIDRRRGSDAAMLA